MSAPPSLAHPDPADPRSNVGSWLAWRAAERRDALALRSEPGGETLTYRELNALCNRACAALLELGVAPGERVALALPSGAPLLALYFATAKLGAIALPLNTRLAPAELSFQLDDCRAQLVIEHPSTPVPAEGCGRRVQLSALWAALPERAPEPSPSAGGEAPHALLYTSGTTGRPKGALLPHRKTLYNSLNAERFLSLQTGDVVAIPVPLFHSFGLAILSVPALLCGATALVIERFDPLLLQEQIRRHGASVLGAVPVMYQRMWRAGLQKGALDRLRIAFSAGAPLDPELIRAYHAAGVPLIEGYGQTETSILCCMDPAQSAARAGSVGRPVTHGEIRVGDEHARALPAGETGEILVRGPIRMLGYWERPEETRSAELRGWHRTGDLAKMDEDGYVHLVGRLKDLYISGGENVYPAEVERVLEQHPDVREAAVVGIPDPEWGERGRAYVVCEPERFDPAGLTRFVRERLAHYKCPTEWVPLGELPRGASGKVEKHRLGECTRRG